MLKRWETETLMTVGKSADSRVSRKSSSSLGSCSLVPEGTEHKVGHEEEEDEGRVEVEDKE